MAKFALRLRPEEQFETLRDFGFGTPTGAEFPAESRGVLACPDRWQPMYTRASVAMGYEFGVTPVQLAAAYAAIANDGVLLAPTLVREIRDPGGQRDLSAPARSRCGGSVSLGDGGAAARVPAGGGGRRGNRRAGAAGQLLGARARPARRSGSTDGHYVHGEYTASFAAIFPADHPQLVVIVKIDNPQGQLLRRTHRRAGHPDHAAAGARFAPGRDRSRRDSRRRTAPRRARTRWSGAAPAGRRRWSYAARTAAPQPGGAPPAGAGRGGPVRSARPRSRCTAAVSG